MSQDNTTGLVVAIGASAGGVVALRDLLSELPRNLAAPVVIAKHGPPQSQLADVLQLDSGLRISELTDGASLHPGHLYVVPGARHGFFRGHSIALSGTVENSGFRPSIDALFMSLASEHQERAIAVVLSGMLGDGMRGAQVVYDMGGRTIVQDPDEAEHSSMPAKVVLSDHPRQVLSAKNLGKWLAQEIGTDPEAG